MNTKYKKIVALALLFNLLFLNISPVYAFQDEKKYLSYKDLYLNSDKYENINRKIFNFNLKLNKIFVRNVHILWESIVPNFLISGLNNTYSNIEYPKRLVSAILQKDFDAVRNETKRFIINTTIGIGGFIDVANKFFKLELYNEDIEQALAKCKMKCGNYLVLPFLSSTSARDITGRIFDFLLTPSTYIASPIAAAIKLGLLINKTAYIQPIIRMVESNFADPYDIARKFYGLEKYIKLSNFDRKKVIQNHNDSFDENELVQEKLKLLEVKGSIKDDKKSYVYLADEKLSADIILENYNPQSPITDSMRTVLFSMDNKKSFWADYSIWSNNFIKKIKSASVNIVDSEKKYNFRYILQKNKTSPLAFIFPSIGEGVCSSGSEKYAQLLYSNGYSVVIIGSQFQWEFLNSLIKDYKVGLINEDVKYINQLLDNIVEYLSKKYNRTFLSRIALGTSLGAYSILFLANNQYENFGNNIDKFIAISPPFELIYAIEQIDNIIAAWKNYPNDLREKIAFTGAKIIAALKEEDKYLNNKNQLPFTNYEAKLISGFLFHQKLSDLIYVSENRNNIKNKKGIYELIYNMDYSDYLKKYFLKDYSLDEIKKMTSLSSISNYLINKDNYVIYEGMDDYLLNNSQLRQLRSYCDKKLKLVSNGSHLGYMYRDEFLNDLVNEIKINKH